jgi:hypothetical protein
MLPERARGMHRFQYFSAGSKPRQEKCQYEFVPNSLRTQSLSRGRIFYRRDQPNGFPSPQLRPGPSRVNRTSNPTFGRRPEKNIMSRQTPSLFGKRAENSVPTCPKCRTEMRLTLTTGKEGLEEYGYECSHCGTNETRVDAKR